MALFKLLRGIALIFIINELFLSLKFYAIQDEIV